MGSQHKYFDHVVWVISLCVHDSFQFRFRVLNVLQEWQFWFSRFSFVYLKHYCDLFSFWAFSILVFGSFKFDCEIIFARHFDRVRQQACNNIKWCEALSYSVLFSTIYGCTTSVARACFIIYVIMCFVIVFQFRFRVLNVLNK